jgi:small nuclear ribonucleoprotein (snRNP)-like protein
MYYFRPRPIQRRSDFPYDVEDSESSLPQGLDCTGKEAEYLKSLVDSKVKVTVVLVTGESLRGRIRYYDRDCFSLGPAGGGPKIFLRKSSVRYIAE